LDFPWFDGANAAANIASSSIMEFVRKRTSKGQVDKGHQRTSSAIATLKEYQDVIKPSDLTKLAQQLAL
jgi:hypothetical protein